MANMFQKPRLQPFIYILACFALIAFVDRCTAQDAIPAQKINALKKATVFVRVREGRQGGTGSGFLIGKKGKWAYIITNEHVVRQRSKSRRVVEVDFDSGTAERRAIRAEVLSEDKSRDLAVLKIKNENLPDPIKLVTTNQLQETIPVYILGYPFGDALSTNQRGPNVTIGKGSISSIRTDDFGAIDHVQVDGDINPGNSGGPIVFADGTLMGVSVATVLGTQIGIGIPNESVLGMLNGRVGGLSISRQKQEKNSIELKFTAALIDPLGKIKRVSLLYIPADKVGQMKAGENGQWTKISSRMKDVKLDIDNQTAKGSDLVRGDYGTTESFFQQVKFTNGKGETFYTSPVKFDVRFAEKEKKSSRKNDDVAKKNNDDKDDDWIGANAEKDVKKDEEEGWLGSDADGGSAKLKVVVETTKVELAGEPFTCVDATCRKLDFEAIKVVANMVWSGDHSHFFVLQRSGVLRKVSFPELVQVAKIDLASPCNWLGMSKAGVCVLCTGTQDLIVLDEESLESKTKVAVGEAKTFGASPGSSFAYFYGKDYVLSVADLGRGKVVNSYPLAEFNRERGRLHEVDMPTVSPDGEYLFCEASECLHKLRINGNKLTYVEGSERIGSNSQRIDISNDSRYVAMPAGGGNGAGYTTYIYRVSDLSEKVLVINSGAYPQAIALDKKAGMIYAQDHGVELKTFSSRGQHRKNYDLAKRGDGTKQFLVHPGGRQVIVLAEPSIFAVELPK